MNASSSGDDFIEPRWSITSIYNPEYQGIVDEQERREKILPGQWLSCRDGTLIIGWNKQEGLYFKQPDSNQHFEEDLASLESDGDGHKTFLTKSEHREIEENAAVSILRDYGSFFSEEVIQRVFPGVDLQNPQRYDFDLSMVRMFVLTLEDYHTFYENYGEDRLLQSVGVNHKVISHLRHGNKPPMISVGTIIAGRDKDIIVVREPSVKAPKNSEDRERIKKSLGNDLFGILRHELLHSLFAATNFPEKSKEAIVDYYAIFSDKDETYMRNFAGFSPGPGLVNNLVSICVLKGMNKEDVCRALLTSSAEESRMVNKILKATMGRWFMIDFTQAGFSDIEAAYGLSHDCLVKLYAQIKASRST